MVHTTYKTCQENAWKAPFLFVPLWKALTAFGENLCCKVIFSFLLFILNAFIYISVWLFTSSVSRWVGMSRPRACPWTLHCPCPCLLLWGKSIKSFLLQPVSPACCIHRHTTLRIDLFPFPPWGHHSPKFSSKLPPLPGATLADWLFCSWFLVLMAPSTPYSTATVTEKYRGQLSFFHLPKLKTCVRLHREERRWVCSRSSCSLTLHW